MRWIMGILGAGALLAGMYFTLPKIRPPELSVLLNTRKGNANDAAFEEGFRRAVHERNGMAGAYTILTEPSSVNVGLPGHDLRDLPPLEGWITAALIVEAELIARDLEARGLKRLLSPFTAAPRSPPPRAGAPAVSGPRYTVTDVLQDNPGVALLRKSPSGPPEDVVTLLLADAPEAFLLEHRGSYGGHWKDLPQRLRERGFTGPVYVAGRDLVPNGPPLNKLEGARVVLARLKPAPPEFAHPFTYVAYTGARAYFDLIDARPRDNPADLASELRGTSIFDLLRGEPALLDIREGALVSPK